MNNRQMLMRQEANLNKKQKIILILLPTLFIFMALIVSKGIEERFVIIYLLLFIILIFSLIALLIFIAIKLKKFNQEYAKEYQQYFPINNTPTKEGIKKYLTDHGYQVFESSGYIFAQKLIKVNQKTFYTKHYCHSFFINFTEMDIKECMNVSKYELMKFEKQCIKKMKHIKDKIIPISTYYKISHYFSDIELNKFTSQLRDDETTLFIYLNTEEKMLSYPSHLESFSKRKRTFSLPAVVYEDISIFVKDIFGI